MHRTDEHDHRHFECLQGAVPRPVVDTNSCELLVARQELVDRRTGEHRERLCRPPRHFEPTDVRHGVPDGRHLPIEDATHIVIDEGEVATFGVTVDESDAGRGFWALLA